MLGWKGMDLCTYQVGEIVNMNLQAMRRQAVPLHAEVAEVLRHQILSGDLNPTAAFMGGKLTVDGDMGTAMKLGSVLG